MKRFFSSIFFLLVAFQIVPDDLITFFYYTDKETDFISVKEISPFTFYADNCVEIVSTEYEKPYSVTGGRIVTIKPKVLSAVVKEKGSSTVHIFVIPDSPLLISKGGVIISDDVIQVVFIKEGYHPDELLHELGHALFSLADEYGTEFYSPGKYKHTPAKNISYEKNNIEWDMIARIFNDEKIGFYEGGAGFKNGVYRSYPDCLMKSLDSKFCPVCFFYAINRLNELTNKDFDCSTIFELYKR